YQPRPFKHFLTKTKDFSPKNLCHLGDSKDFLEVSTQKAGDYIAFILQDLQNLTYMRRYIQNILIFDFPIIDTYQILEALVYGADGIVLTPCYVSQKQLKILSDFASKVGLESLFFITNKEDLTKAIFAGSNILILSKTINLAEFIGLIPNHKVILCRMPNFQDGLTNPVGIDSYIVSS
ncbi:MAG: hypothetical protein K2I63_03175, partial [Helicobacter sp.]|nr:hypothetical protein [Helicobacter sp.]